MMDKILHNYNSTELETLLAIPKYRAMQLFKWLNRGGGFEQMSDLSKEFRMRLAGEFIDSPVEVVEQIAAKDGTEKYLYRLSDGNVIEGVLMRYSYGNTLCVSTQVGCRMNCSFCASTIGGLVRNLDAGEILCQVIEINRKLGGDLENRQITNIVLMGSGEPLDNFDNVVKFLQLVNNKDGLNISHRNISLSTCGLIPGIDKLSKLGLGINLTISLHSPKQETRQNIMPIAKAHSLQDLMRSIRNYFNITKRRIIFEYVLIKGVNDSLNDAIALSRLIGGLSCHVNVIRLNSVAESGHKASTADEAKLFVEELTKLKISATLRRQLGVDINGACGQLRAKYVENSDKKHEGEKV